MLIFYYGFFVASFITAILKALRPKNLSYLRLDFMVTVTQVSLVSVQVSLLRFFSDLYGAFRFQNSGIN